MGNGNISASRTLAKPDPRLLEAIGRDYAQKNRVWPIRRVGALTLVAAEDMWDRLETLDHLEATLGPVTFVRSETV